MYGGRGGVYGRYISTAVVVADLVQASTRRRLVMVVVLTAVAVHAPTTPGWRSPHTGSRFIFLQFSPTRLTFVIVTIQSGHEVLFFLRAVEHGYWTCFMVLPCGGESCRQVFLFVFHTSVMGRCMTFTVATHFTRSRCHDNF